MILIAVRFYVFLNEALVGIFLLYIRVSPDLLGPELDIWSDQSNNNIKWVLILYGASSMGLRHLE